MQYVDEMENKLDEITKFFIFNQEEFKAELEGMLKMTSSNLEMIANMDRTIHERDQHIISKEDELEALRANHEESIAGIESKYSELAEQFEFLGSLLTSQVATERVESTFKTVIDGDFMKFSNMHLSHIEDAQVMKELLDIDRKLEKFIAYPPIYSKKILSISGAIGSQKKEFIDSLIEDEEMRAMRSQRSETLSIPTYMVTDTSNSIIGYTQKGDKNNLTSDIYEKITGVYADSFDFDIKEVIPFILVKTPLNSEHLKNICIIDTPILSSGQQVCDSFEYENRHDIDAMIWMVDIESETSIPTGDLEFLKLLESPEKKLYIVANKIETRKKNDIKKILTEIKTDLKSAGVDYTGISAYSTKEQKEYSYINISLFDFFAEYNKPILMQEELISDVYRVFDKYRDAIADTLKNEATVSKQFDLLELDLKEEGLVDDNGIVSLRFSILRKLCREKELEGNLKLIDVTQNKFISSINKVFGRNINI